MISMDEAFAAEMHSDLIQSASGIVDSLITVDLSIIKHDRWRAIAALAKGLSVAQREALQDFLTEQWVNGAAAVFSVIQGVHVIDGFDEHEFHLTYGVTDVGRDALTNFLMADERARPWVFG